jgi:hypothetical protein
MNVCHLFCLIKYSSCSCSSRLAQPAQWYHPVPILSQTHLSETRCSPDSRCESAKPKNRKKKTASTPKRLAFSPSLTSFPVVSNTCLFIAGRDTVVHSWYSTCSDLVCGQSQRPDVAAAETAAAAAAAAVVNLAGNLASMGIRM